MGDASNSRRTRRSFLPPRVLGLAVGLGGSALAVLVWWLSSDALGRDAIVPWVVLGGGLLLAWGLALSFGMAAAAREHADEGLEDRRRLEAELAELTERARQADSLRREVDGYRQLFDTGEMAKVSVPVVPGAPAPAPPASPESRPQTRPGSREIPAEPPLHESLRDPLTGLFHRRYFEASLGREIHRMERRNLTLGILLLQVDSFDAIVEIRGRESADALLQTLADLLKRRVRGGDVASHNGRGEFGLILPEAPLEGVRSRAEQLRAAVKEMRPRGVNGAPEGLTTPASFTLSLGVAAYPECGLTFEKLLRSLRDTLQQAVSEGGDRVSVVPGAVLDRRLMLPD
jgi:diguanylate cyclase (GGDEF)-like protein